MGYNYLFLIIFIPERDLIMQSLSQFVKEQRKRNNLTQQDLAERAGVGLRFVRELEQSKPTLQMNKVNDVLYLFGYELGPVSLNSNENGKER